MTDKQDEKRYIETVDTEGNPIKLYLLSPNYEISRMCDIEYKKAWTFCFQEGVKTHAALMQLFKENGSWTEEHELKLNEVNVELAVNTVVLEKLQKEKKPDKESVDRIALQLMELRNQAAQLSEQKQQPYMYSCEHAADQIRMEAYVAYATVFADDHGRRYFKDYKDFTERREEQAALDVYNSYLQIVLKENSEYIRNLPENKHLVSSGVLDENLRIKKTKALLKEKEGGVAKKPTTKKKATKKKTPIRKKKTTKKKTSRKRK